MHKQERKLINIYIIHGDTYFMEFFIIEQKKIMIILLLHKKKN